MSRTSLLRATALLAATFAGAFACTGVAYAAAPTPPSAPPAAAASPPDRAVDAARGCWIQRDAPDGRASALLRLLPDRDHPEWLSGQLSRPEGDDPDRRVQLWLARDGRSAVLASRPLADPRVPAPAASTADEPQLRPLAPTHAPGRAPGSTQTLVLFPQARIEFARVPERPLPAGDWPRDTLSAEFLAGAGTGPSRRLRVQASEERLALILVSARGTGAGRDTPLFDGRRDGCD
ncbi:hypothetical protein [Lysobacter enzymogenes]|uniref:hypothetical protein n=1 Tax=Lysobacter enzymogenes TaxID=69 RepID=UPI00099C8BC0|nr:hypothetical protein [Lysobacter enzymogenes]UZW58825.1 hypothetical protein BV903_016085 [Lysobacter enzymogenes]